MAKVHTSDSEDLYNDIPSPSTPGGTLKDGAIAAPDDTWLVEDERAMPSLREAELKKAEMKLYAELLASDMNKRKENVQVASDYEELKKQVSYLKAEIADKDAKLSELTQKEATLKRNISSLYRTARNEIDRKDLLMAEINRELDDCKYPRNVAIDPPQKKLPQRSNERPNDNCKVKPNGSRAVGREDPKDRNTESSPHNKDHSDGHKKSLEQSSSKRKRSRSPPSEKRNCKTGTNFHLNKGQKNNSKTVCNAAQPVERDSLYVKKKQSFDSSSSQNTTELLQSENSNIIQRPSAACAQNTIHTPSNENSNNSPNCDSSSAQVSVTDHEPSIAEVFSKMQELAFKDPVATNAIFFNLLPGELRQSFTEFEKTQTDALNKLKQSFVSCYFAQCSASSSSSEVPTPEESTSSETKAQNSAAFFFQSNSSLPNSGSNTEGTVAENCSGIPITPEKIYSELNKTEIVSGSKNDHTTVTEKCFDSLSKPQDDYSEGNEIETESVSRNDSRTVTAECSYSLSKSRQTYSDRNKAETVNVSKNCYRTITKRCSDSLSKPQDGYSEGNNLETASISKNSYRKATEKYSDSLSKSQENYTEGTKMETASVAKELKKKPVARPKLSKQVIPKLHRDENSTLYTQRQQRWCQNP